MSPVVRASSRGVVWGLIAVCCGLIVVPRLVSAERRDPLPSPLYQHSLKTSIDKFDGPAASKSGGKVSRERAEAAQAGGGGTQRLVTSGGMVQDCWHSQAFMLLSLDPTPSGCGTAQSYFFGPGSDPFLVDSWLIQAPPYSSGVDIPIEMVSLELTGNGPSGPGSLHLSPSPPSGGSIDNVVADGGGNFQSGDAHIDLHIDIEIVSLSLHSVQPIQITGHGITTLPPIGSSFNAVPSQFPIPLLDNNNIQQGWLCGLGGYIPIEEVTCPPTTTPTMEGAPSCHGAATCAGFYTCMSATCAAIQTCQSVTCTAEPTCAGSEATCSPNPTCPFYPSCAETQTCGTVATCIGSTTCRGSSTCPGAPTCTPPPTYESIAGCGYSTMNQGPSCHGVSTCSGSYTCVNASCAAFQTCVNPSCTSEPTCSARTSTCSYTPTCPVYPSCQGTSTCGASTNTCIGAPTCRGTSTCLGVSTCDTPGPTMQGYVSCGPGPSCDGNASCDGTVSCAGSPSCDGGYTCQGTVSCDGTASCDGSPTCTEQPTCYLSCQTHDCGSWPTTPGWYTCGDGACPTSIAQASCPGQWLCPTYSGYYTCPSGSCITSDGTMSCDNGPACVTWSNFVSCDRVDCDSVPPQPTMQNYASCGSPANCPTWIGAPSCPGDPFCPPPQPTIDGASCAILCVPATMQGNPTCAGVASCAPNPSCRAFGTCAGAATCAPAGTCGANTCPNFNTCAGFVTCAGSVTCDNGHTCAGNVTCANANTCAGASLTCSGSATCNLAATCGGWPTCAGGITCGFALPTCAASPTCATEQTCPGAPTCAGQITCDGSPTCALAFTCGGWPTCQAPPYDIPCDLKLCVDSLRSEWLRLHIPPESTQAFEWYDWHAGPIHPLLIWDEMSPKIPGIYVITVWIAPPIQVGIVDTEYVRFPYWVDSVHVQDDDGDAHVSVGDFVLLKFASPAAIAGQSAWFEVSEIGKSRPQDKKFIVKLHCARPLAVACACNCHADPTCDGVTDILDVVNLVNVAFRNFPAMPDPNAACPVETTDTDCDGDTDIIDVTHMVNVAFRNFNPATEFCDPCP